MILIILSNPVDLPGEHDLVNALLEEGLEYYHIRKPEATPQEVEKYLKGIHPKFLRRISLHQHYDLIKKYNVGGIHLKSDILNGPVSSNLQTVIKDAGRKGLKVSGSTHSVEEIMNLQYRVSYVTVSPVFNSLSKPGYAGNHELLSMPADIKSQVIALGGICEENINDLSSRNFSGCALLGTIWEGFKLDPDVDMVIEKYRRLVAKAEKIEWKQKDLIY